MSKDICFYFEKKSSNAYSKKKATINKKKKKRSRERKEKNTITRTHYGIEGSSVYQCENEKEVATLE